MGNNEFHACKSQEQQRRRKKMGFPRQLQMRQKSTTAAAGALLTDQVVLKVYRKVVQEMQQPWLWWVLGLLQIPWEQGHSPVEHRRGQTDMKCQGIRSLLLTHHSAESPTVPAVEKDLLVTAPRATALWCL